jgi:hypothetical protein
MADELVPNVSVEDSKIENLDVHDTLVSAADVDSFDEILVPGDEGYIDSDMQDPAAGLAVSFDALDSSLLPVPSIDLTSVVKTREVLATGEVVYDVRFNVTDIGADRYEVAYVKQ